MTDSTPRRIRPDEAAVLTWMLTHASSVDGSLDHLLPTVERLFVSDGCGCGCCSLSFSTSERGARRAPIANAVGRSASGATVDVYVWGTNDRVTGLEVIGAGADAANLPPPETLQSTACC